MKLGCLFGHKWDGCICTRCEQVRDEGHNFAPVPGECIEKCTKCGKEIQKGHTWSRNGRGCKCVICGASRNTDDLNAHTFPYVYNPTYLGGQKVSSCTCSECGYVKKTLFGGHIYRYSYEKGSAKHKGVCTICGKEMTSEHNFDNGVCTYCGYKPGVNLRSLIIDFATKTVLTLDESELDEMERKLLDEGDAAENAIFNFLAECSYGGVGNIRWWSQAKRLTRMLPKFKSPEVRRHLEQLADNASRTNIWEYHTEIANVAKEELGKL